MTKTALPLHHHRPAHLYRHLFLSVDLHAFRYAHTCTNLCLHFQIYMTNTHPHKYSHTKSCTEHIHRQAYSSPAFCIGDTFHYSKLLSGDVVSTSRGDMHPLPTRYTLIMHTQALHFGTHVYVFCAYFPNCEWLCVGHLHVYT